MFRTIFLGTCINRIRLEFKEVSLGLCKNYPSVLIESDWNLKCIHPSAVEDQGEY